MVISLIDYQFIGVLMAVAMAFFYLGQMYEYDKHGGSYDLKKDLRKAKRESEKMYQLLHGLTHHASVRPGRPSSVDGKRHLESVKG